MENLNAEQVKKALECCTTGLGECCAECPNYNAGKDLPYDGCMEMVMRQGLALINSQEQRIKELVEEAQTYKKHHDIMDAECSRLEKRNDELTEENERLRDALDRTEYALAATDEAQNELLTDIFKIEAKAKAKTKADTVKKFLDLVKQRAGSCEIIIASSIRPIDTIYQISNTELDKIAKEMLEGEK